MNLDYLCFDIINIIFSFTRNLSLFIVCKQLNRTIGKHVCLCSEHKNRFHIYTKIIVSGLHSHPSYIICQNQDIKKPLKTKKLKNIISFNYGKNLSGLTKHKTIMAICPLITRLLYIDFGDSVNLTCLPNYCKFQTRPTKYELFGFTGISANLILFENLRIIKFHTNVDVFLKIPPKLINIIFTTNNGSVVYTCKF